MITLRAIVFALVTAITSLAAMAAQDVVRIPEASAHYRVRVERAAAEFFGLAASPARLAGQLHQESLWKPDARSAYAIGLAQFTPSTARWLPSVCPEIGAFDPWSPDQAIRGAACYDAWLYRRALGAASECDRWGFTLAAYNGGAGWVQRDRNRASALGADPSRWFESTAMHSARAEWAFRENRSYVERILLKLEPAYIAAGWDGEAVCLP